MTVFVLLVFLGQVFAGCNAGATHDLIANDRASSEGRVVIPDTNLRAAIEYKLGKTRGALITRAEMMRLDKLFVGNRNIRDLTGLEFASRLMVLDISSNTITDLTPLSGLTLLTGLYLSFNTITDLTPLSGLILLQHLNLDNNTITDLEPLSGLIGLEGLNLHNNTITDLEPLMANWGLGSGDAIDVSNNPLSTTSINTHIPALQRRGVKMYVDLIRVNDESITVRIPDTNLRAVIEESLGKARGALITKDEMANLLVLEAQHKNIRDLTGLEFASRLKILRVDHNSITDISPLSGLTSLTWLFLSFNTITDVSALSGMTSLKYLLLASNTITDLTPLSGLTSLVALALHNNMIKDLSPLIANPGLNSGDEVHVIGNPLSVTSINKHIPVLRLKGVKVSF